MEEIESAVCTGIHEERKLLFTDGLSADAYEGSEPRAQSLRASRDGNLKMLQEHEDAARQGHRSIEQAFRNALSLRSERTFTAPTTACCKTICSGRSDAAKIRSFLKRSSGRNRPPSSWSF